MSKFARIPVTGHGSGWLAPAAADITISCQVTLFVPVSRAGRYGLSAFRLFRVSAGESETFPR